MLLDMIYFSTSDRIDAAMTRALRRASGIPFNGDYDPYFRWIWSENPGLHPRHSAFMAQVYGEIDPGFADYCDGYPTTLIGPLV